MPTFDRGSDSAPPRSLGFLKQTTTPAGYGDVDMNRFKIRPRVNSAFKRAQPLPPLASAPAFPDRLRSDSQDDLPGARSIDTASLGEAGRRIINLERVRFE